MDKKYLLQNVIGLTEANLPSLLIHEETTEYKSKIAVDELADILVVIKENFVDTTFQNKDLSPLIQNLSARQTPSRLKRLVESGQLEDLGGSPKSYKLTT